MVDEVLRSPLPRRIRFGGGLPRETFVGYASVACLTLVAGAFLVFASSSYDRVIARGERQAGDAASFFAEHGSRLFEAADLATREAVAAVENEPWDVVQSSSKLWQSLRRLCDRFPYIDVVYLVDETGRTRLVTSSPDAAPIDVSDREYFRVHRQGQDGLYVSRLLVSRATERPGFALSRRIGGEEGGFRGVATSLIDVRYLAEFYRSVNLPYRPVISLFRHDLEPLAQYPSGEGDAARRLTGASIINPALTADPLASSATLTGRENGRDLIVAYAKIDNVPLYVSVAIERSVLRDVWLEESRVPGAMALVALLALGTLALLVFRQARRDERAKRMLESEVEARTVDLRSANTQLEVLVQEVHHRVKNNLQVISSMLRLQSIQMSDEGVRKALQDSVNRVHAMSLVHEMLSSSDDRAGLEFRQYLKDLTDQLKESYGVADRVAIVIECDDLHIDMTLGILLALIVNEIFSNALKHAFPQERPGELRIALVRQDNGAKLTIRDNGVGLPPGLDWRKAGSLGLQIVHSLTAKLGGEASLASSGTPPSTCFSLTFPLPETGAAPRVQESVPLAV